ncbi:MAG: DUF1634 domain-containing protein [Acidobacteriota bacterium]
MTRWTDERIQWFIGTLLRAGVIAAGTIVLAGGAWYLAQHGGAAPDYATFRGEPSCLRSAAGVWKGLREGNSRSLIQLGLLLMIATPVARVAFAAVAFALQRDRTYTIVSLIVLSTLIYSLFG